MTINRALLIAAVVAFVVAFIITVGWVDAEGDARDGWLVGGFVLFAGSFLP